MSYKLLVEISPNLQLWCSLAQMWTDFYWRSKVKVTATLEGIFSPVSRMHRHTLMKLITVTHYQVRMTLMVFQGHGFRGQGHDNIFQKCSFWQRQIKVLPSKTIQSVGYEDSCRIFWPFDCFV